MCLDGSPFVSLENVEKGDGLEVIRMIMSRFDPMTAHTNISARQSERAEDMGLAPQQLDRNIKVYEELAWKPLE